MKAPRRRFSVITGDSHSVAYTKPVFYDPEDAALVYHIVSEVLEQEQQIALDDFEGWIK